nr:alpha/beta hydrolases superfamily protein [Tanacetum cinerariifolium]
MKKDSKIYKGKKERVKSIALKFNKESSDDETSTSGSDDEEYAMAIRNYKKFLEERPLRNKEQKLLGVLGVIAKMKPRTKPTKKLMTQSSNESANSLNEMLNVQRSPNSKVSLGFDKNEVSTSGTIQVHFVRSAIVLAGNGSTIPGSVDQPK